MEPEESRRGAPDQLQGAPLQAETDRAGRFWGLVSPSGMVETPRLEAKQTLRNGRFGFLTYDLTLNTEKSRP